jgi:hypothetical protein
MESIEGNGVNLNDKKIEVFEINQIINDNYVSVNSVNKP